MYLVCVSCILLCTNYMIERDRNASETFTLRLDAQHNEDKIVTVLKMAEAS